MGPRTFVAELFVSYAAFSLLYGLFAKPEAFFTGVAFGLFFGAVPVLVFGLVLGFPLSILLRGVRNQWLHVIAFFAAGVLFGFICAGLLLWNQPRAFVALVAGVAGIAAAIGRLSVWKYVRTGKGPLPPPAA